MRIFCPMHHFTDDPKSGIETGLWNFVLHLAKRGHEIHVATVSYELTHFSKKELKKKGIRVFSLIQYKTHGLGKTESLLTLLAYFTLRLRFRYNWIYIIDPGPTHFDRFPLGARVAARVLVPDGKEMQRVFQSGDWLFDRKQKNEAEGWTSRQTPILYTIAEFIAEKIWYKLFPVSQVGKHADLLLCEGSKTYHHYKKERSQRVAYLPLGVEDYRFKNTPQAKISPDKKFIYLFVGRIQRMKGIYYLIDAFKEIAKNKKDVELRIIGRHHGIYTHILETSLKGIEDRVKLLGEMDRMSVIQHIRAAHVIVDPMVWANFSTIALEALYCGKPFIGALYGNTGDFVEHKKTGFLVDARQVNELHHWMEYVHEHYPQAQKIAEEGKKFVQKHLTWKQVTDILLDYLEKFSHVEAWLAHEKAVADLFCHHKEEKITGNGPRD